MKPDAIDDAPGGPPIRYLWAWIAIDAMEGEGIIAGIVPGFGSTPFVTGSKRVAREVYGPIVKAMPAMGRRFELRRYKVTSS